MTGYGRGCFSAASRLTWRRGGRRPLGVPRSRPSNRVRSRSASRRRPTWRPPGSIFGLAGSPRHGRLTVALLGSGGDGGGGALTGGRAAGVAGGGRRRLNRGAAPGRWWPRAQGRVSCRAPDHERDAGDLFAGLHCRRTGCPPFKIHVSIGESPGGSSAFTMPRTSEYRFRTGSLRSSSPNPTAARIPPTIRDTPPRVNPNPTRASSSS